MNMQRSRIACIAAILLIVGIVAFITHDRNAPVEQVRVYELPETDTDGTGKTETLVSGQPTGRAKQRRSSPDNRRGALITTPLSRPMNLIQPIRYHTPKR